MRLFKTDSIFRYFKIIPLIIFIFSNSIAFGATVTFVDRLAIKATSAGEQTVPLGVEFNPDGTKMYMTGTSSNKVFQYISFGCPIVSSNVIAQSELVNKYKIGVIFEDNNAFDLSNKIIELHNDKNLYSRLKQNCLDSIEKLNNSVISNQLISIYE